MDYIPPDRVVGHPGLAGLLPEALARGHGVLPQGRVGREITLLVVDPNDLATMDLLRFVLRPCADVRFATTSREAIRRGIERVYGAAAP